MGFSKSLVYIKFEEYLIHILALAFIESLSGRTGCNSCLVQEFTCLEACSCDSPALFGHSGSLHFLDGAIIWQNNCCLVVQGLRVVRAESGLQ